MNKLLNETCYGKIVCIGDNIYGWTVAKTIEDLIESDGSPQEIYAMSGVLLGRFAYQAVNVSPIISKNAAAIKSISKKNTPLKKQVNRHAARARKKYHKKRVDSRL